MCTKRAKLVRLSIGTRKKLRKTLPVAKLGGVSDEVASPKISVVVPVYKVEKYLRECVESVLAQSFGDFELILVDDGSPDKSGEICEELAKKDSRIRVFHQENGGETAARWRGVQNARSEWICFLDSDDLLPPNALKDLFDEADDNTDWVHGQILHFKDVGGLPKIPPTPKTTKYFDWIGLAEDVMRFHRNPWGKLFRKRLFSPHVMSTPRDIRMGPDAMMNIRLVANKPRKPKEISSVIYFYRLQENSICYTYALSENYNFRYADLLLAELENFPAEHRQRVRRAMAHLLCSHAVSTILYGGTIIARRELAALVRPGIGKSLKCLLVWACLRFNFLFLTRFAANTYRRLHGRKLNEKPRKIID